MEETKNKTSELKKKFFNFKTLNKILFFFIIILGIFYIAGTNDLSTKGFALNELKLERDKLAGENNKLELKIMALSSYGDIGRRIDNLKMVAVGNVNYLSAGIEPVAKK